jgi:hypothetical protein
MHIQKMKILLSILLVFVSAVCLAEPPNKAEQELDIREATFRYQFGNNASGQQKNTKNYYLSIDAGDKKTDPDDAFLKRFTGSPPVKKVSECDESVIQGVVDKKTGEPGLVFRTGAIKWISDTEVEVSGGYYEGNLSSSGNTYYLKRDADKWKVIKNVMQRISWTQPMPNHSVERRSYGKFRLPTAAAHA